MQDSHRISIVSQNGHESDGLLRVAVISVEADAAALRGGRVHELADRREDGGVGLVVGDELLVGMRLELIEALDQFLVGSEQLAQLPESTHASLSGVFEVANCDLKTAASSAERRDIKSSWNRAALRLTASFRGLVESP
jgi:hypothetical protein